MNNTKTKYTSFNIHDGKVMNYGVVKIERLESDSFCSPTIEKEISDYFKSENLKNKNINQVVLDLSNVKKVSHIDSLKYNFLLKIYELDRKNGNRGVVLSGCSEELKRELVSLNINGYFEFVSDVNNL